MTDPTGDLGITRGEAVFLLGGMLLLVGAVCYLVTEFCPWLWGRWRNRE